MQKAYYDKKTKLRILQLGQKCLILLPTAHNKLLAQWKGPYEILERVPEFNYIVNVDGKRKSFHINKLKDYYTPTLADVGVPGSGYAEDK